MVIDRSVPLLPPSPPVLSPPPGSGLEGQETTWFCRHCGQPVDVVLPVEPLYDLAFVAPLMPTTGEGLRYLLDKYGRGWPMYFRRAPNGRGGTIRYRMLSASQVRALRSKYVRTTG